ncbi:hypothetical protein FZI91_05655 [Mycobacterium sp. CBMA271]|nr:hypothetical protein [Mycobacteroides sp. CBMA 271]
MMCIAHGLGDQAIGQVTQISSDAVQRALQIAPPDFESRPACCAHQ